MKEVWHARSGIVAWVRAWSNPATLQPAACGRMLPGSARSPRRPGTAGSIAGHPNVLPAAARASSTEPTCQQHAGIGLQAVAAVIRFSGWRGRRGAGSGS
jgi:hypothetical protein